MMIEGALDSSGCGEGHDSTDFQLGCYFTEFPEPIRTIADFVAALKRGVGRPGHREGVFLASGPVG